MLQPSTAALGARGGSTGTGWHRRHLVYRIAASFAASKRSYIIRSSFARCCSFYTPSRKVATPPAAAGLLLQGLSSTKETPRALGNGQGQTREKRRCNLRGRCQSSRPRVRLLAGCMADCTADALKTPAMPPCYKGARRLRRASTRKGCPSRRRSLRTPALSWDLLNLVHQHLFLICSCAFRPGVGAEGLGGVLRKDSSA